MKDKGSLGFGGLLVLIYFLPIFRFGYLDFLFLLNLPSFGFRKRFRKHDIRKLITAPIEARMAVIKISSIWIMLKEDRKVPQAVPIQMCE